MISEPYVEVSCDRNGCGEVIGVGYDSCIQEAEDIGWEMVFNRESLMINSYCPECRGRYGEGREEDKG